MNVVIIGATSAIAQEVAKHYANAGASLFLVARNEAKLLAVASDLRVRGAYDVDTFVADLTDRSRDAEIVAAAGLTPDVVLIAHGSLPDQRAVDTDPAAQVASFELNATSTIALAAHFANVLERNHRGTLAVIGSVAGDRGRRSNYTYGAAKAAVHAYCEGLGGRLAESGARVVLIKPGWVDTPMTREFKKNPLFASAASVAKGIHRAIGGGGRTVYVPGYWGWISLLVRMLPARFVKF
ncbi:MAG TPA: SDR family NAD(P)-dependent oxidoreductase [Thermoanaerobaculia bacterium]|jgi:short-subunit dehydrogenase|nr:SDR family NAD(P)-dependent oxidoreductase [Thermoanaerobaculia bacterium]